MSALRQPTKATSVRQSALENLREALLAGQFPPGHALTEAALSSQMRISRGPVREALLVLEQEGLVDHHPNHGFTVVNWDHDAGAEMAVVRLPLEIIALELACKSVNENRLRELDEIKRRILNGVRARDAAVWIREDLRFHEKIWEWSGNMWLMMALRRITYPFFVFTLVHQERRTPPTPDTMEQLHNAFVDYLRGNRERTAEECVRLHLDRYSVV